MLRRHAEEVVATLSSRHDFQNTPALRQQVKSSPVHLDSGVGLNALQPGRRTKSRTHGANFSWSVLPWDCADPAQLPDTAVETILGYLPAKQAISMVARSRSLLRGLACSRYCMLRLSTMVDSLDRAEAAFHARRVSVELIVLLLFNACRSPS